MVDEQAFRQTLAELDKAECPFAKALLAGRAACSRARRYYLADREGVECVDAGARACCNDYLARLRGAAGPALGLADRGGPLPHGLALKLQVGGLDGLAAVLARDGASADTGDVAALLAAAVARHGRLADLPLDEVVAAVVAFTPRRRR